MAIGEAWENGAWVDESWVVGAWVQASATKTIGATSQLGAMSSTGGIDVVVPNTIGGTSQLEAFTSTGELSVQTNHTLGGVSQLGSFASSGGISAGVAGSSGQRRLESIFDIEARNSGLYLKKHLLKEDEEIIAIIIGVIDYL
jgi:hypothetical protein